MKKPKSVPSSSSYRENINASEDLHSKSLGCMSGIFHFVYNKYHHNRKSLTFGKKKTTSEKNIVICSSTKQPSPSPAVTPPTDQPNEAMVQQPRRFSCEVVPERSTGIAPEIRRSNSVNSPANFRPSTPSPPHSVVARLMGLTSVPPESKLEKRRKLMGALEKCDQDLKALKKIIDAVRSADLTELRPDPTAETEIKTVMSENEQPSPVSVLDELTRSPTLSQTRSDRSRQSNEFRLHRQEKMKKKSGGGEDEDMIISAATPVSLLDRMIKANTWMKRRDDDDVAWPCTVKMTLSRGMMESVEQVCKDIAWGQNREVGRIGLALHDHICRDLIEEVVKELGYICRSYSTHHVPRFEACKRSLRF